MLLPFLVASATAATSVCTGSQTLFEACENKACETVTKVDAEWDEWKEWSSCSCTYTRDRSRAVKTHGDAGGLPISGVSLQAESCSTPEEECHDKLPVDCELAEWSAWGQCGVANGCPAMVERSRKVASEGEHCGITCGADGAPASTEEKMACTAESRKECGETVECALQPWEEWGDCSATCGGGQMTRQRAPANDFIKIMNQGKGQACLGDATETTGCNEHCCNANHPQHCAWSVWSAWSACSAPCDGGEKTRYKIMEAAPKFGGDWCADTDLEEVQGCNTHTCHPAPEEVDGTWGAWSEWGMPKASSPDEWDAGACTVACDGGYQFKARHSTPAKHGGRPVEGDSQEYRVCNAQICDDKDAVDCEMSAWSAWGGCSADCNGNQARSRVVATHGILGGKICEGSLREIEKCNEGTDACTVKAPVDCVFGSWAKWTECSATCGGGNRQRAREISKHTEFSGEGCTGETSELEACGEAECVSSLDCQWGEWSKWGACTKECGGGTHTRWRGIEQSPKHNGKACEMESSMQVEPCSPEPCEAFDYCVWSAWTGWSDCVPACGEGERSQSRSLHLTGEKPDEEGDIFLTQAAEKYQKQVLEQVAELNASAGSSTGLNAIAALGGALVATVGLVLSRRRPESLRERETAETLLEQQ